MVRITVKSDATIKFTVVDVDLGTEFWTSTNIADGLNALAICIEVILLSSGCGLI